VCASVHVFVLFCRTFFLHQQGEEEPHGLYETKWPSYHTKPENQTKIGQPNILVRETSTGEIWLLWKNCCLQYLVRDTFGPMQCACWREMQSTPDAGTLVASVRWCGWMHDHHRFLYTYITWAWKKLLRAVYGLDTCSESTMLSSALAGSVLIMPMPCFQVLIDIMWINIL
jgi:hypothetical protein